MADEQSASIGGAGLTFGVATIDTASAVAGGWAQTAAQFMSTFETVGTATLGLGAVAGGVYGAGAAYANGGNPIVGGITGSVTSILGSATTATFVTVGVALEFTPVGLAALGVVGVIAGVAVTIGSENTVARLFEASNPAGPDPWLADITMYRNLFLHREPIGAMAEWLVIQQIDSRIGPIRTVQMAINVRPGADAMCDALSRFVDLYARLSRLADFAARIAPYAARPPNFVLRSGE
jgi:hypothetical protein